MDAVNAFFIDVMHMFDEGLSRWFLRQIVEGGEVLNLRKSEIKQIDTLWLSIAVPGHESRKTRSIAQYKKMKAHEVRFFIQHGAPYVTKDIVPEDFHTILCLAKCAVMVEELVSNESVPQLVTRTARSIMGMTESILYARGPSGICRLIVNPEKIPSKRISQAVMAYADHHGFIWADDKIHLFKRAVVEAEIPVRTRKHNEASCRNESIVFERTGKVIAVKHIVAILSVDTGSVLQTLVFAITCALHEQDTGEPHSNTRHYAYWNFYQTDL
ncbi:hypothetical protein RvY_00152 [Ramazzottius varieornatus]|uniref:Uncharacterized protein n=1 Tax=Ramazzottius varieornatus TaxID=947166 RepID=A0A1D1ULQ1_RAMVA|nr:hypothetical protein RvY_00152 [Ramazzottius varieornatus]